VIRVHDSNGMPMAATFDIGIIDGAISLLFNSAGGKSSQEGGIARNADYAPGLELVLQRLGQVRAILIDAYVDSSRVQQLPLEERRLDIADWPYPIHLSRVNDFDTFRKRLTSAQRLIGKVDKTKGGNERKRVRMQLEVPGFPPTSDSADRLSLIISESQVLFEPQPSIPPSKVQSGSRQSIAKSQGGGSSGQGFITDVPTKLAIEAAAMDAAIKHYEDQKWSVQDVSTDKVGYDLLCERGDERLCVEVKGTTQPPKSVLVSRNEVSFALANPDRAALFVLSDIEIEMRDGIPIARGGKATLLEPWTVELDRLSATGYNYALDGLT
jgi:hypothetical protein